MDPGKWGHFNSSPVSELLPPRIIDVARDFPHCNAVAVDLVPMQSPYAFIDTFNRSPAHSAVRSMPPNCR